MQRRCHTHEHERKFIIASKQNCPCSWKINTVFPNTTEQERYYNSAAQKVEVRGLEQCLVYQELKNRRKQVQNGHGFFPEMYILQEMFDSILDMERKCVFPMKRGNRKRISSWPYYYVQPGKLKRWREWLVIWAWLIKNDFQDKVPFRNIHAWGNISQNLTMGPFYSFSFAMPNLWKFPGQGSNPSHSSNPSLCTGNARFLTRWATRELWDPYFRKTYSVSKIVGLGGTQKVIEGVHQAAVMPPRQMSSGVWEGHRPQHPGISAVWAQGWDSPSWAERPGHLQGSQERSFHGWYFSPHPLPARQQIVPRR